MILKPKCFKAGEIHKIRQVIDSAAAYGLFISLPICIGRCFIALADLPDAGDRFVHAVLISDDIQLRKPFKLADGDVAGFLSRIFSHGIFKNSVFKFAYRTVGKGFYLRCRREELFEISREVADYQRRQDKAEHRDGYRPAGDLPALSGLLLFLFLFRFRRSCRYGFLRLCRRARRRIGKAFAV